MTGARAWALAVAAAALAACGGGGDDGGEDGAGSPRSAPRTETTRVEVIRSQGDGGTRGFDAGQLYQEEARGVVTVVSLFGGRVLGGDTGGGEGIGSGFVLDGNGEIVTNAHVVTQGQAPNLRRADEVYVEFADGNQVPARIVGADPFADIALLRIDPSGLTLRKLPLGDSSGARVGMPVAAIGSPFGERQSLSVGVISAIDRSIESLTNFEITGAIQTDAAINPGNSGGPLVTGDGKVIGVNQQIKSASGGGEGVGFAVPADAVRRSVEQLRDKGRADYAYLGVGSVPLYPQLVERFDLPVKTGAWLQEVRPGGPAARAGLRGGSGAVRFQARAYREGGDVLTKVDGEAVVQASDVSEVLAAHAPGDRVALEIWRDGKARRVQVQLGRRPLEPSASP
jgi:S1-C subfamily serine protease